ncbi:MAG: cytochrome c-type biogenesis protein CcmH [Magnetovibrio sp.]|nr:cytochrome c-type biogenesis protein CcmH [Magnetovibrio sp.]
MFRWLVLILALAVADGPAMAVNPSEVLADPLLEKRAREISKGLRCVVCQNQSIDDSDATLARDLRVLVRERLVAGDSDQDVVDYVVSRYGEFVLLKPPFKFATAVLWVGPAVIVLAALAAMAAFFRRQRRGATGGARPTALSDDERRRLDALMKDDRT